MQTVPPWVVRNGGRSGVVNATTADFGASDLWVFSSGNEKTPFAARYRDGHWSKVILPAFAVQVSAVAPHDIWATGSRSTSPNGVLMHWNGRTWTRVHFRVKTTFVNDAAQDGHGGIWIVSNGPKPRYQ